MNRTERSYSDFLELRKRMGEVAWYRFEGIKLRLADNTFLTVDFAVMLSNGALEMHDVKGGPIMEDANVKLKVAADQYPFPIFIVRKGKTPTSWTITQVSRDAA
jgi:hypothetical protein